MLNRLTFLILGLLFLVSACSQKKDSDDVTANHHYGLVSGQCYDYTANTHVAPSYCTTNSAYYMSNGICYSSVNGQRVDNSLCSSIAATNGYFMSNGYCMSPQGQVVNTSYCQMNNGGATAGQCMGYYIWNNPSTGQMQTVNCSGMNCRGFTLIEQSTGRQVYCQ